MKFGLEVHPTEIAFDIASAERTLDALDDHPAFGFNYDPSHLGYQGVDYIQFIYKFAKKINHVHMKDAYWSMNLTEAGVFGGHTEFGDKRRYEEEFTPTVRMVRSFIVNFFKGHDYIGDIDNDAAIPYMCRSGKEIDTEYLTVFNKFKSHTKFDDSELITAAKMFAKLHDVQFEKAEAIEGAARKEYKIKAYSLAVISSWAFAADHIIPLSEATGRTRVGPLQGCVDPRNEHGTNQPGGKPGQFFSLPGGKTQPHGWSTHHA